MESQPPGWDQDGFQPPGWQPDAVGGGGDTTPDPFGFVSQTGVALSTLIVSAPLNITGFDTDTTISVLGGLEYSFDGVVWLAADGTISPAQSVQARLMASALNSTAKTGTLIVGGISGTFTVTTRAADGTTATRLLIRIGDPKIVILDPEDDATLTLDWTGELGEGVTLSSVVHSVPTDLDIESENTDPTSNHSEVTVSGATHGAIYQISARATLSTGEQISRSVTARGFNL